MTESTVTESGPTAEPAGERATPFYCPYCGDEDLRPHGDKGGSWHCRGCARVFTLKFVGLEVQ
jgi:ribosomal protein L37AE/L43A